MFSVRDLLHQHGGYIETPLYYLLRSWGLYEDAAPSLSSTSMLYLHYQWHSYTFWSGRVLCQ
jgi:hypothetical protein